MGLLPAEGRGGAGVGDVVAGLAGILQCQCAYAGIEGVALAGARGAASHVVPSSEPGRVGELGDEGEAVEEECVKNNETRDERYGKICEIVDCSNGVCEHDPIRFMKPMLQASFCLQPPGDTPTRRSTFDGIIAGCIPVFFEDQSARVQYGWHLREEEFDAFSVTVAKEDVVFKGLSIVDVLMGIPRGEVRRMREKVMELIPRVMYRKHGSSLGLRTKKDAFDIAIDGVLGRIRDRVKGLEVSSQ